MSFEDIKNLIRSNGNISLDKLNSTLKQGNVNQEKAKSVQSIFTQLDKNNDGKISVEEWENLNQDYEKLDENQDGVIDENEMQKASENSLFKTFGNKVNEFVDVVKQSFTSDSESVNDNVSNSDIENKQPDTRGAEMSLTKNFSQTFKNDDSTTQIDLYNEDQHFEFKATNLKHNSNDNYNVKNLDIINSEGFMIGKASYVVNGKDSTTAYGINASNIGNEDPENKNLDVQASVRKSMGHKSEDGAVNVDYSAVVSLDNLQLTSGKTARNEEDRSLRDSNYTINANLKDIGNFDAKHTLTREANDSTITNTQSIGIENDDISASVEKEKLDNDGNKNTKKADATYNKELKKLDLDLSSSLQTNDGTRINSLNLNSATDELNTRAAFESTKQDNNGNSSSLNLGGGYNEDLELNAQHSKVKKRDDNTTITNTQTASLENDTVSLSLTNNSADNDGNTKNRKAETSYNTDSGAINLDLTKNSQNEENNRINTLNISSNTKNFEAKATFNSTKDNGDGSSSSINLSGGKEADGSTALGFGNSRVKNTDDGSVTTSNDATLSNNTEHTTSASFTNKKGVTVNNEDGTSSNIEREITVAGSTSGSSEANYRIDKTKTVTNEQGEEVEQNETHEVGTHYNREEKALDLHYSQSRSENGELQSSLDINGTFNEAGTEASVQTSKLNKHGRMVRTEVAANTSDEAKHLGLKFKRNINNTSSTPVDGVKPKKSKSLFIKADVTRVQTDSKGDEYNEFFDDYSQDYSEDYSDEGFSDEDSYEEYGNEDDLSQDYDYSDGVGQPSKSKTDVDVKTRYRVGNDAVSVETHNLEGGRVGYSHSFHNKDKGLSGSTSAFTEYDKENRLNIGVGTSRIKRYENGRLKNAAAASVSVNPQNGNVTATTGYAAPIRNKAKEQVGNMSTYAQYNSKDKSVTVGGQMSKIVYKNSVKGNEQSKIYNTNEDDLFNSESDMQENTQDVEEMETIGNNEIADSYTVEDDLNNASQISEEKQVAGGYHIRAEVGHASNRNPAVQYNIDAQGFVNTNIAGKNSTVYGRVTSTNGHMAEVNNVYGGQLNNPMQNDIRDVAAGHENMEKYRETSFKENEGSEVNNVTTVGMGAVIGNPEQQGTNFAGAANAVFEDGKMTNFTAMSRGEYVYNTGENRQAFGVEAAYNIDKNSDTRNFAADAYYDKTFNNGKTRINTGFGYAQNSSGEQRTKKLFTSFGARQQVAKNVDMYGQFEFGQTKGIGSMGNTNDTYMATRIGAQYHINKNTVVFGEYNVGHGSAMSQTRMVPQAEKDRMKAGNITFGIGMRF